MDVVTTLNSEQNSVERYFIELENEHQATLRSDNVVKEGVHELAQIARQQASNLKKSFKEIFLGYNASLNALKTLTDEDSLKQKKERCSVFYDVFISVLSLKILKNLAIQNGLAIPRVGAYEHALNGLSFLVPVVATARTIFTFIKGVRASRKSKLVTDAFDGDLIEAAKFVEATVEQITYLHQS